MMRMKKLIVTVAAFLGIVLGLNAQPQGLQGELAGPVWSPQSNL